MYNAQGVKLTTKGVGKLLILAEDKSTHKQNVILNQSDVEGLNK